MTTKAGSGSPLKVFHQIIRSIRQSAEPVEILQQTVDAVGWHLRIDRCVALGYDEQEYEAFLAAQFARDPLKKLAQKRYQLHPSSEWYRLLVEGKPIPLTDIQSEKGPQTAPGEFDQFILDSDSAVSVAFPLVSHGDLLGCLTFHLTAEDNTFSEETLELGEAIGEELSSCLRLAGILQEKLFDSHVFSASRLPLVVLEPETYRVVQINAAGAQLLDTSATDPVQQGLEDFFAEPDAARLRQSAGAAATGNISRLSGLLARSSGGQPVLVDAVVSSITAEGVRLLLLCLLPPPKPGEQAPDGSPPATGSARLEELVASLSRQLTWERLLRQIVTKLHASLDRDTILQSLADTVGRALRTTACLIIRAGGTAPPTVTHEYADPDLSPLGLGRTAHLPQGAITCFRQRTTVINDLAAANRPPGLSRDDQTALMNNGVLAIAGAPISVYGTTYGIIVVQSDQPRQWDTHEIELMENAAVQAALSLSNAQSAGQLKDQLFNMNLISNLTQQLTNVLDQSSRAARTDKFHDAAPAEALSTPLSARELEVLKLIASGLANREIAQKLFLTESTVELHASRIRKKLKLKSRTALVKYACDNHLV